MDAKFNFCLRFDDLIFLVVSWLEANKVEKVSKILLQDDLSNEVIPKAFNKSRSCDSVKENNNRVIML